METKSKFHDLKYSKKSLVLCAKLCGVMGPSIKVELFKWSSEELRNENACQRQSSADNCFFPLEVEEMMRIMIIVIDQKIKLDGLSHFPSSCYRHSYIWYLVCGDQLDWSEGQSDQQL